jgi:DNA polymerase I-like protein with 3'-5' exonuclease and polymerase domains
MNPPLKPVLITSDEQLHLVESFLERTFTFGLDLETNVTETFYDRKIRTITIGDKNEQYVIDLLGFAHGVKEALVSAQGNYGSAAELLFGRLINVLRKPLQDYTAAREFTKVGQNLQFDYEMLKWNLGIRMWNLYDTLLAEKIIFAGLVHYMATNFWGLEDLTARYTGLLMSKEEQKGFDFETPLTQQQIDYCGLDVRLPMAIRTGQMRVIEKDGLARICKIEFDAIPAFGDMYLNGFYLSDELWMALVSKTVGWQKKIVEKLDAYFVPIVGHKKIQPEDVEKRDAIEKLWRDCPNKTPEQKAERAEYRKQFMVLRKAINDRTKDGEDCEGEAFINYGSPAQLRDALYQAGFAKRTLPDTNDRTLEKLSKLPKLDVVKAFGEDGGELNYSIIDLIRLHRSTNKALTTYGVQWTMTLDNFIVVRGKKKWGTKNPFTGRIHSRINQLGAATGRTSSTDPNIQNIPKESEYRYCFIAPDGSWRIITTDMSGAELRIIAEMSGEPVWVNAFNNGWDVHSVCAQIIFGKEWDEGVQEGCAYAEKHAKCKCKVHKKLRDIAKTLNFGLAYGMGPQKLAEGVGITFDDALTVFEKFKAAFPIVFDFLTKLGEHAKTYMEARDMAGRRRRWKRPTWDDAKRAATEDLKKNQVLTDEMVRRKYKGMFGAIEREGKNCPIQASNATFIKLAMGCGFDVNGKPYLWHVVEPIYATLLVNMVHDELVHQSPEMVAEQVEKVVGDAMTRASAEFLKKVVMETESHIDSKWSK